jgi:predicted  nucleic acid-binding Zn-ribbon protein
LIAAGSFLLLAFGSVWTIMQSEFSNVDKTSTLIRSEVIALADEVKARIADIHGELRHDYIKSPEFTQSQKNIDILIDRIKVLESHVQKTARDPVEAATMAAALTALNKQIDLLQAQIADINRQIAAALIIIDNNATVRRSPLLPP